MKSLNEVLKELEKINKEEPDTPIFNLEDLSIDYRRVNKMEHCKSLEEFDMMARGYVIIYLQAKVQKSVWDKYTFPINDLKLAEQFYEEDKTLTPKYREIEKIWSN